MPNLPQADAQRWVMGLFRVSEQLAVDMQHAQEPQQAAAAVHIQH